MDYKAGVETLLGDFCDEKVDQALKIDERYAQLWREIKQYLLHGGKRMRPRLVMLAYGAYGGKNPEAIIPVAAAWELLHASLLVHDDIIDRDLIRHGQPNIAGRYQSIYGNITDSDIDHYALSAALLGGNLLLTGTYELVNRATLSSDEKLLVHSYLHKALFTVAGGELVDTDSVLYPISQSNPQSVAEFKTASYSLQLPLQCGAILAGASDDELQKLSRLGLHVGIAYQFQDDLLGVFGDTSTTGKSNRSDIIEKKRTYLIHKTIELLSSSEVKQLTGLYESEQPLSESEAEKVVQLISASGSRETIAEIIEAETKTALEITDNLSVDTAHRKIFLEIISKLTSRTS